MAVIISFRTSSRTDKLKYRLDIFFFSDSRRFYFYQYPSFLFEAREGEKRKKYSLKARIDFQRARTFPLISQHSQIDVSYIYRGGVHKRIHKSTDCQKATWRFFSTNVQLIFLQQIFVFTFLPHLFFQNVLTLNFQYF